MGDSPSRCRSSQGQRFIRASWVWLVMAAGCGDGHARAQEPRANYFGDPFIQITAGIADCPAPEGPMITPSEMRAQAHHRAERGATCFQAGRCRLANAYQYDQEIIPRVGKAVLADGRFADTSIWAEGRRRWVWLKGCVRTPAQAQAAESVVRGIDDVEAVIGELVVWPQ